MLRIIYWSQETIQYPCFKPELVSVVYKDPYTYNIKILQNFEKV